MERPHVIVTGATGFVGGACVREFLARGWAVTALVHRRAPARLADVSGHPGLSLAKASVTDRESLLRALAGAVAAHGGRCQALVHCAGRAADIGWDREFRRANLTGVERVCEAVRRLSIERLIHISTTDVYGVRDFADADEETPFANNRHNPYPKYKILAEARIRRDLPRERYVILRPALVWGPGDTTVMPRAIGFLRASPVIIHFGRWRGANRWPLAYVGNVARVAYAAAVARSAPGHAYNVVDPEATTMEAYYRLLIELFLPGRPVRRSVTLPVALAWPLAALSTALATLLGRDRPLCDPSLYGLRHVSHDQHFSGARAERLLKEIGLDYVSRESALASFRAEAPAASV